MCKLFQVKNVSNLTFEIPRQYGAYTFDPSKACLMVQLKLTNKAGTDAPAKNYPASLCDNILHSLFKSLRISYNGTTVCHIKHLPLYSFVKTIMR